MNDWKSEAIRLRESGYRIAEIAERVGVARSSVSTCVRNVVLSDEYKLKIEEGRKESRRMAGDKNRETWKKRRLISQEDGRCKSQGCSQLYLIGCMLYWAEGTKNRSSLQFTNSDPVMMSVFMRFIRDEMMIPNEKVRVLIQCYTDFHNRREIEDYWLNLLGLGRHSLMKTRENPYTKMSTGSRCSLEYGTCRIQVNDQSVLQRIYGSIQEFCGEEKEMWAE